MKAVLSGPTIIVVLCLASVAGCASSSPPQAIDIRPQIDSNLTAAAAAQMNGQYRLAAESLATAEKLSQQIDDVPRRLAVLESLGCLYTLDSDLEQHIIATQPLSQLTSQPKSQPATTATVNVRSDCACGPGYSPRDAYSALTEALRLSQSIHDDRAEASVVIDLGNFQASREQFTDAIDSYQRAGELAAAAGDDRLLAHALTNTAMANASAAVQAADQPAPSDEDETEVTARRQIAQRYGVRCLAVAEQACKVSLNLANTLARAQLLTAAANSVLRLYPVVDHGSPLASTGIAREKLPDFVESALKKAIDNARDAGDQRTLSFAFGALGKFYEIRGDDAAALEMTRRAISAAQQAQIPESLYRWQWQAGRLLRAGDLNASVNSYRQAVATLQSVRNDIALHHGNRSRQTSFRRDVGRLYFELADVLLEQAGPPGREQTSAVESTLIEARSTVETLKSAELEDYFQDNCAQRSKVRSIEKIAAQTAVVYFVPLPNRLEILVSSGSGLHRYGTTVTSSDLDTVVRQFREQLVVQISPHYLAPARQLYSWLIRPIEALLAEERIDTIVFVPDGSLATVPMAALEDGHQFLIEKFAIAVTPGLTLMDPRPVPRNNAQPLLSGLSVGVQGFEALSFVPQELEGVRNVYGGRELLNEHFVLGNMQHELQTEPYSIVHVASHAQFGHTAKDTFLLTYDGRIDLNDLQRLIEPKKLGGQPVELLTLSACETAAGDDRAALGLAGAAVKSGARSVLATLWSVNDEASSALITRFYTELRNDPALSKAKALQRAQIALLHDKRYRYPLFWSAYLIIGNWL